MKNSEFSYNDYDNSLNLIQLNNYELDNIKDYYQKENFENIFPKIFEELIYSTEKFEGKDNHPNDYNNKKEQEKNNDKIKIKNNTITKNGKEAYIKGNENLEIVLDKKRERKGTNRDHNKFSDDILIRKVKHILINDLLNFTNNKIYEMYNGNISKGIFVKKLLTLNQRQIYESKVQYNKEFLNKTLRDILSDDISSRFTLFPLDHNKNLINQLLNEKDENKREYFNKYFNLNFLECLEHFRGNKIIEELKGLKGINSLDSKYKEDESYLKYLKYYFNNFESILNKKRTRNRENVKK
jgi:hypothetical protein